MIIVRHFLALLFIIPVIASGSDSNIGPIYPNLGDWKKDKVWSEVYKNIDEQKLTKALALVESKLEKFIKKKDEKNWTIALLTKQNLLNGLHNVEKSVNEFKNAKWPKGLSSQILLNLYYAQTLRNYYQYYSWEINKREKVISKNKIDLKKWTKQEIFTAIQNSLLTIWKRRKEMGTVKTDQFKAYISEGSYPRKVRGTIRDSFTYFYVAFLEDTSFWSAKHSNEKSLLNLKDLFNVKAKFAVKKNLLDTNVSPIIKVSALLTDLEKWHWRNDRLEGLMEARFEKVRVYAKHFSKNDQKKNLDSNLKAFIRDFKINSWWSEGMYLRATIVKQMNHKTALVDARKIALEGKSLFPKSIGAKRCRSLVESIESPSISMSTMKFDLPKKRSIEVSYKNWRNIYFRAYRFDHESFLLKQKGYSVTPNQDGIRDIVKKQKPEFEWDENLKDLGDYKQHKEYFTPKINKKGTYIILASAEKDFPLSKNKIYYDYYQQTDIYFLKEEEIDKLSFKVSHAQNNKPLKGAKIKLYKLDWQKGHKLYKTLKTDKNGRTFLKKNNKDGFNVAYSVEFKNDKIFDTRQEYLNQSNHRNSNIKKQSLIFTDRSVFRPGQKIHFKVVTYENRNNVNKLPKAKPSSAVMVSLYDSNNEKVKSINLVTNEYASTSGEFTIPNGRALGRWYLKTTFFDGRQYIKVEEYKRPTFLTEINDAVSELKLNTKASFKGNAKYYFGMPVVDGRVKVIVRRSSSYPYWYYWWYPRSRSQSQIVHSGTTKTDKKGDFIITFLPKASKDSKKTGVKYQYHIAVEILNEGGETAKASKSFTIGHVGVRASINKDNQFIEDSVGFNISRTDLNGKGLPGKGTYQLFKLKMPKKTVPPSDQTLYYGKKAPKKDKYSTDGDFLRARWDSEFNTHMVLKTWNNGSLIKSSSIDHSKTGGGKVKFSDLKSGAYRIVYETKDSSGEKFSTQDEFIVLGNKSDLKLPLVLRVKKSFAYVGDTVKFFIHSGYKNQNLDFEIFHYNKLIFSKKLNSKKMKNFISYKIKKSHLGGLTVRLYGAHDHTLLHKQLNISIPYVTKNLTIDLERIRKIIYPGVKEEWSIGFSGFNSKGKKKDLKEKAEILAYMYDKSLDVFMGHNTPYLQRPSNSLNKYLKQPSYRGQAHQLGIWWFSTTSAPTLYMDRIQIISAYGIGGMGRRGRLGNSGGIMSFSDSGPMKRRAKKSKSSMPMASSKDKEVLSESLDDSAPAMEMKSEAVSTPKKGAPQKTEQLRSNFSETAFFKPHLISDKKGDVKFSFTVPDSLTSWRVWAHGVTKELKFGSSSTIVESKKDLMVRTYFPRFLRQGDEIALKIVIDNSGKVPLSGLFKFEIMDDQGKDISTELGVANEFTKGRSISIKPSQSDSFSVNIKVPNNRLGLIKLKATAKTGSFTDGELKELNVLPSRVHLIQSKFITLKNKEKRVLEFKDMLSVDKTLVHDSLNVKLDGQLFYSLLSALPYIQKYPYKSSEQLLNSFVTTSILDSTFKKHPQMAKMAKKMAKRKSQYESWNPNDPNRKMGLEETPWLEESRGGDTEDLFNSLKPEVVKELKRNSLKELLDSQTSIGGFPWFKSGPPSLYMTTYVLNGFSRVSEFEGKVPKREILKAWSFVASEYRRMISSCMAHNSCYETITFINYVLSSFKDKTYYEKYFPANLRKEMLNFSFNHWKKHSPQLKGMLSLLLGRMNRKNDSILVFESVMDSAKTEKDLGTFWAPEERSWLWYNDTIETHAYALRTLMEVTPKDKRKHSLVQWLYLNKKLGQWKSTRATSEVIYSVLHYLESEKLVGITEEVNIKVGDIEKTFVFSPGEYTGKDNFVSIKGKDIRPKKMNKIVAEQKTKGMSFVSATWHYSTEKMPLNSRGDFLSVKRNFFKRDIIKGQMSLTPLKEGAQIEVGDQIEIHLSLHAKHQAEYIHLRDPRPSGFEPEGQRSGYKWDLGIVRFEEIRDSGMNFFIEKLPVGEYTLKHRMRANLAGTFRTHPAKLQSLYAPEFNAFSSGEIIKVKEAQK
jgi:uncharacterized protein YfaS (alpha-2-macroglobulin family)